MEVDPKAQAHMLGRPVLEPNSGTIIHPNGKGEAAASPAVAREEVWPQPKPIITELKPVPAFDSDALLPAVLKEWVMDEAERMQCPAEFVAAAVVVALSSIIGARCAIKPKSNDSWMVVPNLWGAVVGGPSAMKTPAIGVALKPLDRLVAKAAEEDTIAHADYETAKAIYDAKMAAIDDRLRVAAKKPTTGDPDLIGLERHRLAEEAPEPPKIRRFKTNDCTIEKLGELLRDNPAGLLVYRDEIVGLIASWDRRGHEGDRSFFLEGWNGFQNYDTDRITRGHVSIPNVCISILGGMQPDKLAAYLGQAQDSLANDGMLQRFQLLVYPDPVSWRYLNRAPNEQARDAVNVVFETLANFDPVTWGAAHVSDSNKIPCFHFGAEAQKVFETWTTELHCVRIRGEEDTFLQQHLTKYNKLMPALALIFHLVENVKNTFRPEGATGALCGPVSKDAALRAAAWCEFLEAHARRCYGLLADSRLRAAQTLAAKIEAGVLPDGFSVRDVRLYQWRNLKTDADIQGALSWLEDEDWIRSEKAPPGPQGGRPTLRYRINPDLMAA